MGTSKKIIILATASIFCAQAYAQNNEQDEVFRAYEEVVGPVYEIRERSIYEEMQEAVNKKRETGELDALIKQSLDQGKASLIEPKGPEGLKRATAERTWIYDPSIVAITDVKDQAGNIIVRKGQRVSPAEMGVSWRPMIFFDATDERQVDFAYRYIKEEERKGEDHQYKPVLTSGRWVDLMKKWDRQVYFDQSGLLTDKFSITNLPATVVQDGGVLRITEIAMDGVKE